MLHDTNNMKERGEMSEMSMCWALWMLILSIFYSRVIFDIVQTRAVSRCVLYQRFCLLYLLKEAVALFPEEPVAFSTVFINGAVIQRKHIKLKITKFSCIVGQYLEFCHCSIDFNFYEYMFDIFIFKLWKYLMIFV